MAWLSRRKDCRFGEADIKKLYWAFLDEIVAIPARLIAFVFGIALLIMPLITSDPYILHILIFCNIFAVFAASWDLLAGYTGQLSLGHAFFFGVGAYSAALLNRNYGLPPLATIPLGAVIAVGSGLIIGIPALRLRGPYLAIVTLAFPLILIGIIYSFPDYTGGFMGIPRITPLTSSKTVAYYFSFLLMAVSLLAMWKLTDIKSSIIRTGLLFRAIREDEITARASGINTVRYKMLAFAVSGFFGGLSGAFYAHYMKIVGPSSLDLSLTFQAVIWTIFGGLGTLHGPVTGVFILYPLTEFLRIVPEARTLIFLFIVILVLLFMPEGLNIRIIDRIQISCPRCKLTNMITRKNCRACNAPLHTELK